MIEKIDADKYRIITTITEIVSLSELRCKLDGIKRSNAEAKITEEWVLTLPSEKQKCVIIFPQVGTKELEKLIEDINDCNI